MTKSYKLVKKRHKFVNLDDNKSQTSLKHVNFGERKSQTSVKKTQN